MNISIAYGWLKELVATNLAPDDFARRLSEAGMGVERISRLGENLTAVVVGTIAEIRPHPNADKLRVVLVDVGKENIEVVCGGTNLAVGMKVAFARVGAKVRWHGEGELVTLAPAEIRGVKSFGMICAASEIGLGDWFPHGEREILDLTFVKAPNGAPLVGALGLTDSVFEIEVTTNRPDALAAVGLAREAAVILDKKLNWVDPSPRLKKLKPRARLTLSVSVKDKKLCPRYQAVALADVKVGESPWWLKKRLLEAGVRPIANLVDITNYVMLETGQPLHVFDYDKLANRAIVVRAAIKGEKIQALDGRDYELTPGMLLIADDHRPAAIAGVMGGAESAVTEGTTRIVFEAANFDPVAVRKTSRALALHTDASQRFEKGLSAEGTAGALARAVALAEELAGGRVASKVFDTRTSTYKPRIFSFDPKAAEALIGVDIPAKEMTRILVALGFKLKKQGRKFRVVVPWWRDHDIEDSRDFAEEIARIVGYRTLPSILPPGVPPLRAPDPELAFEDRLKTWLSEAGAAEIYSYSFVSEALQKIHAPKGARAVKLANPLSAEFAEMRLSLLPSMLAAIRDNQALRPEAALFEISRIYLDRPRDLPEEPLYLALAVYGPTANGEQFSAVKGFAEKIAVKLGASLEVRRHGAPGKFWHPGRTVEVLFDGRVIGELGELHPELLATLGIDRRVAVLYAPVAALLAAEKSRAYRPIPAYPPVKRDLSFTLDARTPYQEVVEVLKNAGGLLSDFSLFDLYQGKGVAAGKKSLAFHLALSAPDRTLSAAEAEAALEKLIKALEEKLGAQIRK